MSFLHSVTEIDLPLVVKELNEAITVGLFTSSFPFFMSYSKIPFHIAVSCSNLSISVSLLYYFYFGLSQTKIERILFDKIVYENNEIILHLTYYHNEKTDPLDGVLDAIEKIKERFICNFNKLNGLCFGQYLIQTIPLSIISYQQIKQNRDKLHKMIPNQTVNYLLEHIREEHHHEYYVIHTKGTSKMILFIGSTIVGMNIISPIFRNELINYVPFASLDIRQLESLLCFREIYSNDLTKEFHIGSSILLFIKKEIIELEKTSIYSLLEKLRTPSRTLEEIELPFILISKRNDLLGDLVEVFLRFNKDKLLESYHFSRKSNKYKEYNFIRYGKEGNLEHTVYYVPFLFHGILQEDVYKKWYYLQQDWNSLLWNATNRSILQIDRSYRIQTSYESSPYIRYLLLEALETWNIVYHKIVKREQYYIVEGVIQNDYHQYRVNERKIKDWVFEVRLPEVCSKKLNFLFVPDVTLSKLHFIYLWMIKKELQEQVPGLITFMLEPQQLILFGYFDRPDEYYFEKIKPILEKERSVSVTFLNGTSTLLEDCLSLTLSPADRYRLDKVLRTHLTHEQIKSFVKPSNSYYLYRNVGLTHKTVGLYEDISVLDKKKGRMILLFSIPNKIFSIAEGKRIDSDSVIHELYESWKKETVLHPLAYAFYKELERIPRSLLYCYQLDYPMDKKVWEPLSIRQKKEKIIQLYQRFKN